MISVNPTTKEKLMGVGSSELQDRYKSRVNYHIYRGACEDMDKATMDVSLLGQSWVPNLICDYIPTIDIRNKIKPLMNKQKRFMFGLRPDILIKPMDGTDKDKAEAFRAFIDAVLEDNGFWHDTQRAFLSATIKKRVLLRVEANPNQPIRIFYEPLENFYFEVVANNYKQVQKVVLVSQDASTLGEADPTKQIWYRYTYYMADGTCKLDTDTFDGLMGEAEEKFTTVTTDTKLSRIPAWVIINGGVLGDIVGESDIDELWSAQNQYNRKVSDFGDALRFQMFGETYIVDADADSVNRVHIAPNALVPIVSLPEKTASVQKVASAFNSAGPVNDYLAKIEHDMYETLSIPKLEDMANIPSAKAMKYAYTDLIARCDEKWHDWEGPMKELIMFIAEACAKLNCYPKQWDASWEKMQYTIVLNPNYPVPEDEEVKKELALKEVDSKVRSHKAYLKDFTDEENYNKEWEGILLETVDLTKASQDTFQAGLEADIIAGNTISPVGLDTGLEGGTGLIGSGVIGAMVDQAKSQSAAILNGEGVVIEEGII